MKELCLNRSWNDERIMAQLEAGS